MELYSRCTSPDRGWDGTSRVAGLTILELLVALIVSSVTVGGTVSLMLRSQLNFQEQMQHYTLDQTGRRIMARLGREIGGAAPSTIVPQALVDSSSIQFQRATDYVDGVVQYGPVISIAFQLVPDETANGEDDNGDGRIDEGTLVFTEEGSPPVGFAGNVLGMRFSSTPVGVSFSVDVGLVSRDSELLQKTFTEQLSFRN